MNDKPNSRRRWFQISLRTLMLLVTLLCAEFAWLGYSLNWIRQRHAAFVSERFGKMDVGFGQEIDAPSFLWMFGELGIPDIWCEKDTAENKATLRQLFPEAKIHAWSYAADADTFRVNGSDLFKEIP
jgi:hypothetical protein